jgi:mono/diheme cytochrome c family protein
VRGAAANTSTVAAPGNETLNSPPNTAPAAGSFDPSLADTFPFPVTQEVLNRGQERYQIFCSMCHGATGKGDGMVVKRGYRQPPSYHTEQLRSAPVGHFFDVITNGWGSMPNYAAQVPVRDRWAIVAYIRALQLSREGTAADLPPATGGQPTQGGAAPANGEHSGGGHQ